MGFEECRKIILDIKSLYNGPNHDRSLALGPCVIDNADTLERTAFIAQKIGATHLRGGAFKLRTNPDSFHGHGFPAWAMLRTTGNKFNLHTISEVTSIRQLDAALLYLDILQIGARSMWNFDLLNLCAQCNKQILLKRGLGATTLEWLSAALRLLKYGCKQVILCERGINTIDQASRYAIDFCVLSFLIHECPLPIWVDVSHSAGDSQVSLDAFRILKNFNLCGLMIEVQPEPERSMCDSKQIVATSDIYK